ncbi:hypothetical protein Btru_054992 [Bulinus truncatus]|nr:hypothetical protein Btru_054992 [Bulinus truncatus]
MRKRARRGRGKGKKGSGLYGDGLSGVGMDTASASSPGLSEDTEVEDSLEASSDPPRGEEMDVGDAVSGVRDGAVNDGAADSGVAATSCSDGATMEPAVCGGGSSSGNNTTAAAAAPVNSNSSNSSVDGDGGSDAGDSEQMHSGFMKTGPKNYRVGSTVVNLNNCPEDDITPEFRDSDICLQVECGDNRALMYLSKLYQGSKGKCIELGGKWFTPNEFQAVSGRESAKDWKRSIRHHGRSLKLLLSKNVLDVHPAACRCDSCSLLQQLVTEYLSMGPPRKQNTCRWGPPRKLNTCRWGLPRHQNTYQWSHPDIRIPVHGAHPDIRIPVNGAHPDIRIPVSGATHTSEYLSMGPPRHQNTCQWGPPRHQNTCRWDPPIHQNTCRWGPPRHQNTCQWGHPYIRIPDDGVHPDNRIPVDAKLFQH